MLPTFKSILCLNGRLPNASWFLQYQAPILIAADGASNTLISNNIMPHFIIGDLDSIDQKHAISNCNVIHIAEQDSTDFEKCLLEMENSNLFPSLVLGVSGGTIDHTIYNLNCFMQYASKQSLFFLDVDEYNNYKLGIPVFAKKELFGCKGKKISLLPFAQAIVSTTGLKWNIVDKELSVTAESSISNIVTDDIATVQVVGGSLLVIIDHH